MPHDTELPDGARPAPINPLDQLRAARNRALAAKADVEAVLEQAMAHIKLLEDEAKVAATKIAELGARINELTPAEAPVDAS